MVFSSVALPVIRKRVVDPAEEVDEGRETPPLMDVITPVTVALNSSHTAMTFDGIGPTVRLLLEQVELILFHISDPPPRL